MKKNNKGFTLIEVIAVIILISVIGVVTMPSLTSISQSNQNRIDRSTKLLIENSAKIYVANYKDEVDKKLETNSYYCIAIGKLKAYDFLNINNTEINITDFNDTCVKVTKTTVSGNVKYLYNYDSNDKVSSSEDYIPPVIYIVDKISGSKCDVKMQASSLEDFYNKCNVNANDNKNPKTGLKPIDIKEADSAYVLTYEYSDVAGNQAKPLEVTLTIK